MSASALSGGVDSSLTAAIAADALGADHVHGVLMPSRHSSEHSVTDAEKLAANLGIDALIVGIEPGHAALAGMIEAGLGGRLGTGGLTDQNLQSRIRGVDAHGVGQRARLAGCSPPATRASWRWAYSTLYGDTAGAFAVISDLWKLGVYELCRWRNEQAGGELIPETVLAKAPSAELAPGQRDDQSLPPYEVLDPVLRLYVEELRTVAEIQAAEIAPAEVVERVCRMVDAAEYKRPPDAGGPPAHGPGVRAGQAHADRQPLPLGERQEASTPPRDP